MAPAVRRTPYTTRTGQRALTKWLDPRPKSSRGRKVPDRVAHAFATIGGPAGFGKTTVYYPYEPSIMVGVDAAALSAAAAEFDRDTAYDVQGPLYFTTAGAAGSLTQLQLATSQTATALHYLIPTFDAPCPFGGCALNDRGELLGFDLYTLNGAYATVALARAADPATLKHVSLQDAVPYFGGTTEVPNATSFPIAFNDADQLLYADATLDAAAVYDVASGISTTIPASGPACGAAVPLSMNNHGTVLGTFEGCATYYTWDPSSATRYLSAEIPSSSYTIFPLGINDAGQILIELQTGFSPADWGTLDPTTAAAAPSSGRVLRR